MPAAPPPPSGEVSKGFEKLAQLRDERRAQMASFARLRSTVIPSSIKRTIERRVATEELSPADSQEIAAAVADAAPKDDEQARLVFEEALAKIRDRARSKTSSDVHKRSAALAKQCATVRVPPQE